MGAGTSRDILIWAGLALAPANAIILSHNGKTILTAVIYQRSFGAVG